MNYKPIAIGMINLHLLPRSNSLNSELQELDRKCIQGSKMPVDLERATSRIWSYALQAERKAVMYEAVIGACLVFEKLVEHGRF